VWDLHYSTPTATRYEYPISAVPHDTPRTPQGVLALPGTYTIRLTVNGKVLTAPLTVKIDPRVTASTADLASLFRLQSNLSQSVNRSAKADLEAHSAREQIQKLASNAAAELKDPLEKQAKAIAALLDAQEKSANSEEQPGLDDVADEALGLYEQVGQADAAPTAAQQSSSEHVGRETAQAVERWEQMKNSSLPALNRKLGEAHLPAIDLERRPETMPEGGDED
jgi:cysteinyl-tRNA synthetase